MEKESNVLKKGMSCTLVFVSFLVVILTTIVVWPYITPYLTPKNNTKTGEAGSTKNTTNSNSVAPAAVAPSAQTPCTVPGTFKESCLDDLWKNAGCNTSVKAAMDGLKDGRTFASQLNYWNSHTLGDVWDDMRMWSANTGDLWKTACMGTPRAIAARQLENVVVKYFDLQGSVQTGVEFYINGNRVDDFRNGYKTGEWVVTFDGNYASNINKDLSGGLIRTHNMNFAMKMVKDQIVTDKYGSKWRIRDYTIDKDVSVDQSFIIPSLRGKK